MDESTTSRRVRAILAEQAMVSPADVRPEMSLAELGIDSMGVVETIFALEEEFGIDIPFNANVPDKSPFDISTVGSVIAAVEAMVAQQTDA